MTTTTSASGNDSGRGDERATPYRYDHRLADAIETKWQKIWDERGTFVTPNPGAPGFDAARPKFYCLDMFPYPSGAGLHVGHPEGYTATDIVSRFMRMRGFNVLHPMGYDAFGLPAEQYAIQTGVHPAQTTKAAITEFRRQLKRFGFSYDWTREVATIDPEYYKWTQWIFLRLYDSWFDPQAQSPAYPDGRRRRGAARPIADLVAQLESGDLRVGLDGELVHIGSAAGLGVIAGEPAGTRRWHELSDDERREVIDGQRLAYLGEITVNWCPALGTVLANDEVVDGKSERGGHPVKRLPLRQWQLRITAYAERLLEDLALLDWPDATKAMQSEWIGRSEGAEIEFDVAGSTALRAVPSAYDRAETFTADSFVPRDPYPPGDPSPRDLLGSLRNLPHLELPGATYFVTWRVHPDVGSLGEDDRTIALDALRHFDGTRCEVYAACVMPDHVHWIVRPYEGVGIGELVASVRRFSARSINQRKSAAGSVWQDEPWDHIVRDGRWFSEFVRYVLDNPVAEGLVESRAAYRWTLVGSGVVVGEREAHGSESRATTESLRVFTTRPDTLFGATYMVVAPEHELVERVLARPTPETDVARLRAYVDSARNKSDVDRQAEGKDKTGVFTGVYATNPATGRAIPVWTADYVLMGYGTGAIMAVPAHDERDFAFAEKFGLGMVEVVAPPTGTSVKPGACFAGEGVAKNSASGEVSLDGLPTREAKRTIIAWLEKTGRGTRRVNYKLRDWTFSRQRYWGEPFPIVYDERGHPAAVGEGSLPVELPALADYSPSTGDEPTPTLAKAGPWVQTTAGAAGVPAGAMPAGAKVRRETNTMPGSAGSSWYFLRYCDPTNARRFVSREAETYWMGGTGAGGVDLYIGGSEHAVGHLLYARMWQKVLFDLGEVSRPEPFQRLFHQGMITSFAYQRANKTLVPVDQVEERSEGVFVEKATGEKLTPIVAKMSKSLKNVVNPDEIIAEFGADTFRLYEMYMGPLEASKPWNTKDTVGLYRFLQRAWRLAVDESSGALKVTEKPDDKIERQLHRLIAKAEQDIPRLSLNTSIAAMIEFVNLASAGGATGTLTKGQLERFVLVLAPFAPHIAEELWEKLGHRQSLAGVPWPAHDPKMLVDDSVEIPVSVNGKVKERITVPAGLDKAGLEKLALADPKVVALLGRKAPSKVIAVPGKMVNLVV